MSIDIMRYKGVRIGYIESKSKFTMEYKNTVYCEDNITEIKKKIDDMIHVTIGTVYCNRGDEIRKYIAKTTGSNDKIALFTTNDEFCENMYLYQVYKHILYNTIRIKKLIKLQEKIDTLKKEKTKVFNSLKEIRLITKDDKLVIE